MVDGSLVCSTLHNAHSVEEHNSYEATVKNEVRKALQYLYVPPVLWKTSDFVVGLISHNLSLISVEREGRYRQAREQNLKKPLFLSPPPDRRGPWRAGRLVIMLCSVPRTEQLVTSVPLDLRHRQQPPGKPVLLLQINVECFSTAEVPFQTCPCSLVSLSSSILVHN